MLRTGGQLVADHLVANDVPYLVGIPGHGCLALLDAFVGRQDIEVLQVRHEQSAVHLADAYFRVSGKPLAVYTSIGPGAVNTAVGLATAYVDSTTAIVFTGDVHTYMAGRGVLQEVERKHSADLARLFDPITKRYWQVSRVDQLPLVLANAYRAAVSGRPGPVVVSLPMDVQADAADVSASRRVTLPTAPAGDSREVERAIDLLINAERPVILAGGGVILANASTELLAVAEATGAAVVATYTGKGCFPERHPQYAWCPGSKGTDVANTICREADVILAVGCRFADECASSYVPGVTFSIPPTRLVQVDIDDFEIGKNYPAEIGIVGDAQKVLDQMAVAARERRRPDRHAYMAHLAAERARWFQRLSSSRDSRSRLLGTSRVLTEVREVLQDDAIVVSAAGHAQAQVLQELPFSVPRTNITAAGFSTMGFTVPAALGAKLAAPDRQVLGICGDGDFLMTVQELATAAQYGISAVYLVLNNEGWHSIRDLQMDLYGEDRAIATEFRNRHGCEVGPDLVALSRAFGIRAERAETPEQLKKSLGQALASAGPAVIEVPVERAHPASAGPVSGWWDVPIPAYLGERRMQYEREVASVRHDSAIHNASANTAPKKTEE